MKRTGLVLVCAFGSLLICWPALVLAQQPAHPVLDAPGLQPDRDYFSAMPFEHIDTFTGSLVLTFTDLVLPGNAGRELRFERSYNSKPVPNWSFGIAGIPLSIEDNADPLPHTPQSPQDLAPTLVMSGGSKRGMAWLESGSYVQAISSDFWKYNRTTRVLSIPNGDTCLYDVVSLGSSRVVQCEDAFGNVVGFFWSSTAPHLTVTQWVGSTIRQVMVTFSTTTSMTYAGRTWTSSQTSATPPTGPGWSFGYTAEGYLNSVTTPSGGVISYEYGPMPFTLPPDLAYQTPVVTKRTTSEGLVVNYTYSFDVQFADRCSGETTVDVMTAAEEPIRRVVYRHGWTLQEGRPDGASLFDFGFSPLRFRTLYRPDGQGGWVEVEREERTYRETVLPVLEGWVTFGTLGLESVTITRTDEGVETAYSTTLAYSSADFADYHQPTTITETGPAGTRVTDRTFKHSTTMYVRGLLASETVTVGSDSFTKSWTYDDSNGFKLSETASGITTEFGAGSFGNLASVVKANGKVTSYENYRYGQPRTIRTPEYVVTRTINADGLLASETQAGRTTAFTYDAIGRSLVTQPPGEATPSSVEYDSAGGWQKNSRGTSFVKTTVDGFGRPILTENAIGVRTITTYDLEGRVIREGYLFKPGAASGGADDIFTGIEYDALGRVTKRVNRDSSQSTNDYLAGGVVKITDEDGKETRQTWKAFGNPADAQLASLRDADGLDWSYEYDVVGRLKKVIAPDGKTRTWTFNPQTNLLDAEEHPESGVTTYQYDAVGLLWKTTDANGKLTEYTYDGNDRVKTITADGRLTTIGYEFGSDNRESATNPSGKVTWRHHPYTGRLQFRQDTIDNKVFTTWFEYDNNDNLTALVYPSGRRVQYELNIEGQATRVWEPATNRNYANGILYHPSGGVEAYYAGNGIATTISYDALRYRIGQVTSGPMQFTYSSYDNVGNPLVITDSRGAGFNQTLTYDNLHRLNGAAGPYGSPSYTYDAHGNRTGAAFQYEPNTLRLSNQSGTAFTYDYNGNTLTAGTATYTYTPQNRVELVTRPGVSISYAYDADDQRVKSTSAGSTTYFIRGLSGELLTEWKDPGTATGRVRDYMYLGTRLLAAVAKNTTADPVGYDVSLTPSHRFATSWQVPTGTGDNPSAFSATAAARTSSHPDMPRAGMRIGVQDVGWTDTIDVGPLFMSPTEHPKQADVFVEFEVERYPYTNDAEWLSTIGGGNSTDDLRFYLRADGAIVLKHDDGRGAPPTLWISPVVGHTRHTLEIRFEYNSAGPSYPLPNPAWDNLTSWAKVYFDGALVATYGASEGGTYNNGETSAIGLDWTVGTATFGGVHLKSPGPANGLLMNVTRSGITAAPSHGASLDHYASTWRTTLLEAAGTGTYSQWTGGQPDWRARSANYAGGNINQWATTNVSGQKISYLMESMASRGITGNIGTVIVGVRMGSIVSANTRPFIRRNGVDTVLTDMVLTSNAFRWYRVATSGWSATDTVEIGVTCGNNSNNFLAAVALLVEHDTPEPAPLDETAAQVVTVPYVGNGGAQTVDLGGMNLTPTVLFVMPATGANNVEPMWWWDSRLGAAAMSKSVTSFSSIWPQKGKFHAVHFATGNSYNANGVSYVAIALFDPSGRYVIPFAVSKPTMDDNYTHYLHYPESGDLASDFTPEFVFGGIASINGSDAARTSLYRGPGHAPDLTAKLGLATPAASEAGRIKALAAGTVQFGTLVGFGQGDEAFWAGRVSDGVSFTRLMAVTSYVGNGASSRNIPLSLNGTAPDFTIVVPTNNTAKAYRVTGDTTGRNTVTGNALANSIMALGADQITVGLALNATNVTYDVWVIRAGTVTP